LLPAKKSGAFVAGEFFVFAPQRVIRLDTVWVFGDAIDRANLDALRFVVVADALGAFVGVDFVNFSALENGLIRAFWFADVAIDTFIGND
jgi:hypothetical protein